MIKCLICSLFFFTLLLIIGGCRKNSGDNVKDLDSGSFLGLVNDVKWHPAYHTATYYPQWKQLWIAAADKNDSTIKNYISLQGGINLDTTNLLKKYPLLPNGDHAFRVSNNGSFYTDLDIADAGGSFTLTKFDTVNQTVSGVLEFTAYDLYATKKIKFSTTRFEDIPLKRDNGKYDGSAASCNVQGTASTTWQTKNIFASINCGTFPDPNFPNLVTDEILFIYVNSIFAGSPYYRNVYIRMPVTKNIGKYPVYPDAPPYINCGDKHVVSMYTDGYGKKYQAVTGEVNVLSIDSLNRKMTATFSIQYRDSTTNKTFTLSNGKLNLNYWLRYLDR